MSFVLKDIWILVMFIKRYNIIYTIYKEKIVFWVDFFVDPIIFFWTKYNARLY